MATYHSAKIASGRSGRCLGRWWAALALALALALAPQRLNAASMNAAACNGQRDNPIKMTNDGTTDDLVVSAIILCTDAGDSYAYQVKYINIARNPAVPFNQTFRADWLGLAVFRRSGETYEWLAEPVHPVSATLTAGQAMVSIGNLKYNIPKSAMARATDFILYLVYGDRLTRILPY